MKTIGWFGAAVLAAIGFSPSSSQACGGTFCDTGPSAMPVDQTGENVLFVIDGGYVEAHVQILYQGDAAKFSWIVPMPQAPTVTVGSQPLFNALLGATVPRYGFSQQFEDCDDGGEFGSGGDSASGAGGASAEGGAPGGGINVISKEVVGAFEVTVLSGQSAQEVTDWLETNGYQSVPTAPEILTDYVEQGFVFAAIKLTGGAGIDQIHPLVFRYQGSEPCVPLKLTSVAAVENMGVRTFFLGDDRVFPTNYKHVVLNPVRLDWLQFGANYSTLVSRAVDSAVANGQAFVTEYAGPSNVVNPFALNNPSWNSAAFSSAQPTEVMTLLEQQGLAYCGFDEGFGGAGSVAGPCVFSHPLVLPLLRQFLPAPIGVNEADFYADLPAYADQIDQSAWNAGAFSTAFSERIVEPGQHAQTLLTNYGYLTRLYTQISPHEMTEDPIFVASPERTYEQVQTTYFANDLFTCSCANEMELPDGRVVLHEGTWPLFSSAMPWAERIEEIPVDGESIVLVDNSTAIDQELTRWNARLACSGTGASGDAGSGGNGATGPGATTTGGTRSARGGTASADSVEPLDDQLEPTGCACRGAGHDDSGLCWLAVGAALIVARTRRRRTLSS
jgi:hypothetical protein